MEEFTEYLEELLGKKIEVKYLWELLSKNLLSDLERNIIGEIESTATINGEIYIGKGTVIKNGVRIDGPVYISEGSWIGPYSYVRHGSILGRKIWIGGATEIKNSILLDSVDAGHQTFIGDSIIGKNCNFGAGTKIANFRFNGKPISIEIAGKKYKTETNKLGAIIEDGVKTGCNVVINPGSYIGKNSWIYPNVVVSGYVPARSRIKK